MVNKQLHLARQFTGLSAALMIALMAGCASAPEEPEPTPVTETEPVVESDPAFEPEPATVTEPVVQLRSDHPETYTVVKGDTLWDIASAFLKDPWMWPELWQSNPQIENPHLIYPGDILTIYFKDGKPVLRVDRQGTVTEVPPLPGDIQAMHEGDYPTVKLKPGVREMPLEEAIPTIPLDAIRSFLSRPRVMGEGELQGYPYVVAHDENHLLGGGGYSFYARGIEESEAVSNYVIVRAGDKYVDPDTGEVLGYEAIYIGEAQLRRLGDPAKLFITQSGREILRGDRLLPKANERLHYQYMPRAPEQPVSGKIISVLDGVARIGQYQVVVLNVGRQNDIEPGHVLAAMQSGAKVQDTIRGGLVRLHDEKAGTVMVFRSFERVSYALVMRAGRAIRLYDTVTNP
ncbi:MAG: LysM peptidoglycan-binding domain-containing protein [Pseudomonadota bacterium]